MARGLRDIDSPLFIGITVYYTEWSHKVPTITWSVVGPYTTKAACKGQTPNDVPAHKVFEGRRGYIYEDRWGSGPHDPSDKEGRRTISSLVLETQPVWFPAK